MMTTAKTVTSCVLALVLLAAGLPAAAAAGDEPAMTVRYRSEAWTFTHDQLLAAATDTLPNMRGTETKPAVPLEKLIFEMTGVPREEVGMIIALRGSGQPVILRGKYLDYLDKIVMTGGEDKVSGEPHEWAMAAEDEATYEVVYPAFGSRRKHSVYRIDLTPKYGSE